MNPNRALKMRAPPSTHSGLTSSQHQWKEQVKARESEPWATPAVGVIW